MARQATPSGGGFLTDTKAKRSLKQRDQEKGMRHDVEGKSKRESHALPKELKAKRRRDTSEVNTSYGFDIVKKADKGAREAKRRTRT